MVNFLLVLFCLVMFLLKRNLTILLDTLIGCGNALAGICATLGIIVFGEIIPKAK